MSIDEKKLIIDYLFEQDDIPPELLGELTNWLLENETDRETEFLMLKKWEEFTNGTFKTEDFKGLKDILKIVSKNEERLNKRRHLRKSIMAVGIVCAIFMGGFCFSRIISKPTHDITLVTAKGNIGEYSLPDGTKVWLNENSRITYPENFDSDRREVKLVGEGFFDVTKDASRPFVVDMTNVSIEVLGTSFGASCYETDPTEEVILKSGSVKISGDMLQNEITLKPNHRLTYSHLDRNISIRHADASSVCRWYEPCITFEDAEFGDILENIRHRYRVDIKVMTSVPMTKRFSMTISKESLETVMDVIAVLLPVSYEIRGGTLILRDNLNR